MLQGQIPHRESFKLCIAHLDAALVLMVELRQAGCQLSAARAGPGNHDKRVGGFNILVGAVAFLADDHVDIRRVALGIAMHAHPDTPMLELIFKHPRGRLIIIARDNHRRNMNAPVLEIVDEFQRVGIIGYTEISPHFAALDIAGIYAQDNIRFFLQILQQAHLHIWIESGQHPGGVIVIEQLAAEFKVQLLTHRLNALENSGGLFTKVYLIVKACGYGHFSACGKGWK